LKGKFAPVLSWQRVLAILALGGAIYNAYGAWSTLTWPGIAWYSLCILALIFVRDPRVVFLLWFAVAAHILFSGYQLWRWQALQVRPCIYCFAAAWCALTAALVMYRPMLATIPPLLLAGMIYAWSDIFPPKQRAQAAPAVIVETPVDSAAETAPAEPAVNVAATEEPALAVDGEDPADTENAASGDGQTTTTEPAPAKTAVKSTPAEPKTTTKTTTTTSTPKSAAPQTVAPDQAPADTTTAKPATSEPAASQPVADPPQVAEPAVPAPSVNENPVPEPDPPAPPPEEEPDSG